MTAFQWYGDSKDRMVADQAIVTIGIDWILECPDGLLYVVRRGGEYRDVHSLPGIVLRRPRNPEDVTPEVFMNDVLRRELGIGYDNLDEIPLPLPTLLAPGWVHVDYNWEEREYIERNSEGIITTDGSPIRLGRVAISHCMVSRLSPVTVGKLNPNNERYSRHEFLAEIPPDLGRIYLRHMETYRRLGPYSKLKERLS